MLTLFVADSKEKWNENSQYHAVQVSLRQVLLTDYPLIAYHWVKHRTLTAQMIPIFYAVAMAVSGGASLVLCRLFDRYGFAVIIGLTGASVLFAPLVFLGAHFGQALLGAALWGMGTGVHESIIPAAVAPMVAQSKRASAFGTFTAAHGVCWFAGSALIGWIYDQSVTGVVAFCVIAQKSAYRYLFGCAGIERRVALRFRSVGDETTRGRDALAR